MAPLVYAQCVTELDRQRSHIINDATAPSSSSVYALHAQSWVNRILVGRHAPLQGETQEVGHSS